MRSIIYDSIVVDRSVQAAIRSDSHQLLSTYVIPSLTLTSLHHQQSPFQPTATHPSLSTTSIPFSMSNPAPHSHIQPPLLPNAPTRPYLASTCPSPASTPQSHVLMPHPVMNLHVAIPRLLSEKAKYCDFSPLSWRATRHGLASHVPP